MARATRTSFPTLQKCPSGIAGLDELTHGGLPRGRPTLVCGRAGSGKTVFGLEFLVRGAIDQGEPGLIVSFEESTDDLKKNVASFGFDLEALVAEGKLGLEYIAVERGEIEETGEYNLDGLFVRLGHAIDTLGAKRVLLDTIEALFAGLDNVAILRSELRRLFRWLKQKGVTAIVTGERGEGEALTRQGLEEYVSDCVIALDVQVVHHVATRMMRVVKYRGSSHGPDEYPFIISDKGVSVLPITSLGLAHAASEERIGTGVAGLDQMLGGAGYYRGSTVLVSGSSGTGKTSIAAHLVHATCKRGERCLYFAFEESPAQLLRNMRSIGIDLEPYLKSGLLRIEATRPSLFGLEMHLVSSYRQVEEFQPTVVIVDPITDFVALGSPHEVRSMMTRLVDHLKSRGVTALMTSLSSTRTVHNEEDIGISSLIDTWIVMQMIEVAGERNRGITVLKSRGMAHSHQVREFVLGKDGLQLIAAYRGPEGFLSGSARVAQQAKDTDALGGKRER